jgi:hypothetical protein
VLLPRPDRQRKAVGRFHRRRQGHRLQGHSLRRAAGRRSALGSAAARGPLDATPASQPDNPRRDLFLDTRWGRAASK